MTRAKEVTKKHFDDVAENYDESYDGKHVVCLYPEIISRVMNNKPDSILDLGCGNGNVLRELSQKTKAKLFGLDFSEKMISEAEKRLDKKVELCVGDAEKLPYDEDMFDMVICNASFHHYTKPLTVIKEIRRVLRPGGTLVLGDPTAPFRWYLKLLNKAIQKSNSGDYHIYHIDEIRDILNKNGFSVKEAKYINYRNYLLSANTCE